MVTIVLLSSCLLAKKSGSAPRTIVGVIGDDQSGSYLSRSPIENDGIWPHESVRTVIDVRPFTMSGALPPAFGYYGLC